MKDRQLVKVVATCISENEGSRLETETSRGIALLKRGQSILDFVTSFMEERGISHFTLNQRSEETWAASPVMFLGQDPKKVLLFSFTVFKTSELGFYAKDLSKEELERDLKQLRKVIQ
jgi:hypothetical protein